MQLDIIEYLQEMSGVPWGHSAKDSSHSRDPHRPGPTASNINLETEFGPYGWVQYRGTPRASQYLFCLARQPS